MIVLIVIFLLTLGAISTFFLPPERRGLQIAVALVPVAALAALLLRIPLPDSFSVSWSPAVLFPEALTFRSTPASISFTVYFCALLVLIEWTRPLRLSPGRSARLLIYLLTMTGIAACFASNPLAVLILWSLIDLLSFLAMLFLKSPVEIGPAGISSSLSHSLGVLALNMLGNSLVLFSLFTASPGLSPEWGILWGVSAFQLAPILFLTGILFRILLAPIQFTFTRLPTASTGTEILLRVVSPAAVLCLLANIWPTPQDIVGVGWGFTWPALLLAVVLLAAGWQWCISSSPFNRRDVYFLILPSFALYSAIVQPAVSGLFTAAGGLLILGGGILLVYLGFLSHRRWMAAFPILLGVLLCGLPFSPSSLWSASVYPGLISSFGFVQLLPLLLCQWFTVCAIFRLAFEPVDAFPSNEPVFLLVYSAGMLAGLLAVFYPSRPGVFSAPAIVFSLVLLAGSVLSVLFVRRIHQTGAPLFLRLEQAFRLEWLQRSFLFVFQKTAIGVSGVESFLSGEGAMLWSLGIALLFYLVFRGG